MIQIILHVYPFKFDLQHPYNCDLQQTYIDWKLKLVPMVAQSE